MKKEYFDAINKWMNQLTRLTPTEEAEGDYQYQHPKTGEIFTYQRQGVYKKDGITLVYKGKV